MIDIEQILKDWEKDSHIDDMRLDEASRDSAKLHSKYLAIHSTNRLELRRREIQFKTLLKDKWLWYNGKMSKAEMDAKGWGYDAMKGLKVLKGDMGHFYDSDIDIQKAQLRIEYLKNANDVLKDILDNVKWRHQNIGNMIRWRQFTSGV
mgnify:CR=1 FL=1|jgi:hypothetical protein